MLFYFALNLFGIQYGILGLEFSFNAPTWFISVLFICYMIFYLIVYQLRKNREVLSCIYIIAAVLGLVSIGNGNSGALLNTQVGRGIASFFVGYFLGKIYNNR